MFYTTCLVLSFLIKGMKTKINLKSKKVLTILLAIILILVIILGYYFYNKHKQEKYIQLIGFRYNLDSPSEEELNNAINIYTQAINLMPNDSTAYISRSSVYFRQEKYSEALADVNKAIELGTNKKSDLATFYWMRGDIYYNEATSSDSILMSQASKDYGTSYDLDSTNQDVLHKYLKTLIFLKQFDKAYSISNQYFSNLPAVTEEDIKNALSASDIDLQNTSLDLWLDRSISASESHRCAESLGSAWIVLMNTSEGDSANDLAITFLQFATRDAKAKTCIDLDTFPKNTNNTVMKNIIELLKSEGKI